MPPNVRPASPERAARLIEDFALLHPIVSRLSQGQLEAALGQALQQKLTQTYRKRVMRSLAVAQVRQIVCAAAESASIDISLLKQSALEATGRITPEQRYATDVDVLIRPADISGFCAALESQGLSRETGKRHAHGVTVLRSTSGIGVELHTQIHDLSFGERTEPVTFDALQQRRLLGTVGQAPSHVHVPAIEIVAAHIIAQGWYLFHYVPNAPGHKSPFRVIVDMGLLGMHRDEELAKAVYSFIEHEVRQDEYFGIIDVVDQVERGTLARSQELVPIFLTHAIASEVDAVYRLQLLWPRQLFAIRREGLIEYFTRLRKRHCKGNLKWSGGKGH